MNCHYFYRKDHARTGISIYKLAEYIYLNILCKLGSIRVLAPEGTGTVISISRLGRDRIQTHGVNISISRLGRGRVLSPGVNISITRLVGFYPKG